MTNILMSLSETWFFGKRGLCLVARLVYNRAAPIEVF
jgi:hypothetical protein